MCRTEKGPLANPALRPYGDAQTAAVAVHALEAGARIIGLLPREQHEALQAGRREQTTEEFRLRCAAHI